MKQLSSGNKICTAEVMWWMILTVWVIVHSIQTCWGSGQVSVHLISYIRNSSVGCTGVDPNANQCDLSFSICFYGFVQNIGCLPGSGQYRHRQSVQFGYTIEGERKNPIVRAFQRMQDDAAIVIDVHDFFLLWNIKLETFTIYMYLHNSDNGKIITKTTSVASLTLSISITCDENFYGPKCSKFCRATPADNFYCTKDGFKQYNKGQRCKISSSGTISTPSITSREIPSSNTPTQSSRRLTQSTMTSSSSFAMSKRTPATKSNLKSTVLTSRLARPKSQVTKNLVETSSLLTHLPDTLYSRPVKPTGSTTVDTKPRTSSVSNLSTSNSFSTSSLYMTTISRTSSKQPMFSYSAKHLQSSRPQRTSQKQTTKDVHTTINAVSLTKTNAPVSTSSPAKPALSRSFMTTDVTKPSEQESTKDVHRISTSSNSVHHTKTHRTYRTPLMSLSPSRRPLSSGFTTRNYHRSSTRQSLPTTAKSETLKVLTSTFLQSASVTKIPRQLTSNKIKTTLFTTTNESLYTTELYLDADPTDVSLSDLKEDLKKVIQTQVNSSLTIFVNIAPVYGKNGETVTKVTVRTSVKASFPREKLSKMLSYKLYSGEVTDSKPQSALPMGLKVGLVTGLAILLVVFVGGIVYLKQRNHHNHSEATDVKRKPTDRVFTNGVIQADNNALFQSPYIYRPINKNCTFIEYNRSQQETRAFVNDANVSIHVHR